jgi:hypothetical protein
LSVRDQGLDPSDSFTSAPRSKTAGSFIRPTPNIHYGVSFLEALNSKYIENLHGSDTLEKVVLGSSGGTIEVEAVSLDKIRLKFARLDHLREVSLDNANVARADPPGHILQTCPGESMPLSFQTRISDFSEIFMVWIYQRTCSRIGTLFLRL